MTFEPGSGFKNLDQRTLALTVVGAWLIFKYKAESFNIPVFRSELWIPTKDDIDTVGYRAYWKYLETEVARNSSVKLDKIFEQAKNMVTKLSGGQKTAAPFIRFFNSEYGLLISANNSGEFNQLSQYQVGDDPRSINYKTSARRSGLFVNRYQDTGYNSVNFIVDGEWFLKEVEVDEKKLLIFLIHLEFLALYKIPTKIDFASRSGTDSLTLDHRISLYQQLRDPLDEVLGKSHSIRNYESQFTDQTFHGTSLDSSYLEQGLHGQIIIMAIADNNLIENITLAGRLKNKGNAVVPMKKLL